MFSDGKPTYRKSCAGNLLAWSDLTLVHCLYGGYNLHRFSDALGLVISSLQITAQGKSLLIIPGGSKSSSQSFQFYDHSFLSR